MLSEKCILLTKNDLQMNYSHKFARHSLVHKSGNRKPVCLHRFFYLLLKCFIHSAYISTPKFTLSFSLSLVLSHSLFLSPPLTCTIIFATSIVLHFEYTFIFFLLLLSPIRLYHTLSHWKPSSIIIINIIIINIIINIIISIIIIQYYLLLSLNIIFYPMYLYIFFFHINSVFQPK